MKTLKKQLLDIQKLESVAAVLSWDQETYMPEEAGAFRAEQLAYISLLHHKMLTGQEFKNELFKLIDEGSGEIIAKDLSDKDQRTLELIYKDWKLVSVLPNDFVEEMTRHQSVAQQAWIKAKKANDFKLFAPYLEKMIQLKKQEAEYYGYKDKPYDALLSQFEPGMTTESVKELFEGLRKPLVELVQWIGKQKRPNTNILDQSFDTQAQWDFGINVARGMGLNMKRARQDYSAHPFTTGFHPTDVRITTRLNKNELLSGLFSTIHESGHALYEQGLPLEEYGTPLGQAASFGIHESQSRLWENMIGRSWAFWSHYFPILQASFPTLKDVSVDDWYKMINVVEPSMVRVEADEVTYSLHIMLRFDMECEMINGNVDVNDLPAMWNSKMKDYFGIEPKSNSVGILQDVHWSMGGIGYFPSYALGNLYAAQMMETIDQNMPDLDSLISSGNMENLKTWLNNNVHKYGRYYDPQDLIKKISGKPLSADAFVNYLNSKYRAIYS